MELFVIGDVHGCYYTLTNVLHHWKPDCQKLIFVGDYIDRGNYSGRVIKLIRELKNCTDQVYLLKGNHEYIYNYHYRKSSETNWAAHRYGRNWFLGSEGKPTLIDFQRENLEPEEILNFFDTFLLELDTPHVKISHAGITATETDVYHEDNYEYGILWTRKELMNIGKLQVIGHTPHKHNEPLYNPVSNVYNIDSGCCYGRGLTGIVINNVGELQETYFVKVDSRDLI
jgi:serine/threonine protein phosphatase 1